MCTGIENYDDLTLVKKRNPFLLVKKITPAKYRLRALTEIHAAHRRIKSD